MCIPEHEEFIIVPSYTVISTSTSNPLGLLNQVPASAGVRAEMSPLPGGR